MLIPPLNIPKWLSQNAHLLQPPINNHCIHSAGPEHDMTIMIVGGPNARTDYHINPTPELFYQYKGSMLLRVVDSEGAYLRGPIASHSPFPAGASDASPGVATASTTAGPAGPATATAGSAAAAAPEPATSFKDIPILEGELFLLPANTPHNPIRFADTVGIVVELSRPQNGPRDRVRWYCQSCRRPVYEVEVGDLGAGLRDAVKSFAEREDGRRCLGCGGVVDVEPSGVGRPG